MYCVVIYFIERVWFGSVRQTICAFYKNKLSRVEVEPSRYGGTATKLVTIINCG